MAILSRRMLMAAAGFAPPSADFVPTDIEFSHLYWTGGSEFLAQGYGDTDAVDVWPDEIGTADLSQGTGTNQPNLDIDLIGGQPAAVFDGTDDSLQATFGATLSVPWTVVAVAKSDSFGANQKIWVDNDTNSNRTFLDNAYISGNLRFGGGGNEDGVLETTDSELYIWHAASAGRSWVSRSGIKGVFSNAAGSVQSGVTIGSAYPPSGYADRNYAFLAFYLGDFTEDPNYFNFLDWVFNTYGIDARPPSLVNFDHMWWTEGADFLAQGLEAGDAVSTLNNEKQATNDMVQVTGTAQPVLTAADDSEGPPGPTTSMFLTGDSDDRLGSGALTPATTMPDSWVMVMAVGAANVDAPGSVWGSMTDGGTSLQEHNMGSTGGGGKRWVADANAAIHGPIDQVDNNWHLMHTHWNNSGTLTGVPYIEIDGKRVAEGTTEFNKNAGSVSVPNNTIPHRWAFLATFDGDVTTDPYWELCESYLMWKHGLFDPISNMNFEHVYWTEGPEFKALGLSDGGAVSSWPDEVDTLDIAQGTGTKQPTVEIDAANGKPAVSGDGIDDYLVSGAGDGSGPLQTGGVFSLTAVVYVAAGSGYEETFSASNLTYGNQDRNCYINNGKPTSYGGSVAGSQGLDIRGEWALVTWYYDSAGGDEILVNGKPQGGDGTAGTDGFTGDMFMFSNWGNPPNGFGACKVAFFATHDEDIRDEAYYPFFLKWVEQNYGIVPQFDPVNDVNWAHAYWTEGQEFYRKAYGDTDAVDNWPDEIGGEDAIQATGTKQPSYQAAGGANSTPAVEALGDDYLVKVLTTSISQPLTLVTVSQSDEAATSNAQLFGNSSSPQPVVYQNAGEWRMYAGTEASTGTNQDTSWHLHLLHYNGASSNYDLDNLEIFASGTNPGTNSFIEVNLFNSYNENFGYDGKASFMAVYDGDPRTDPNWQRFLDWVRDHYGLPVIIG